MLSRDSLNINETRNRRSLFHRVFLEEEEEGFPQVDLSRYHADLDNYLKSMGPEDAARYKAELSGRTAKNMHKVARRLHKIIRSNPDWSGSRVTIQPEYHYSADWQHEPAFHEPQYRARISVHHPTKPDARKGEAWETPYFTFSPWQRGFTTRGERRFARMRGERPGRSIRSREHQQREGTVDEPLDAGDRDFFPEKHPETEGDYFHLVGALQRGRPDTQKRKHVTLYTARPAADRHLYQDATHLPRNLFLTSNPSDAHGIGHDFGGRDVWRIRIDPNHLVKTMDSGDTRHYQIVGGKGKVPIHRISPVTLHEPEESIYWPRTLSVLEWLRGDPCS